MRGVKVKTVHGIMMFGGACLTLFFILIFFLGLAESLIKEDLRENQSEIPPIEVVVPDKLACETLKESQPVTVEDAVIIQDKQICNDSIALIYPDDNFHGHPEERTGGRIGWLTCWDNQLMRVEYFRNHKEGEPMMVVRCYCKEDYDTN